MFTKKIVDPERFTPPIGTYSHGYVVEGDTTAFMFVTGQIAVNEQGSLVSDDIKEQTEYVFDNINRILKCADFSMDDVVKAQIFVTDMNEFKVISEIRNTYFCNAKPVSTLVEVRALVHPGARVEIEVTAARAAKKRPDDAFPGQI